MNCSVSTTRVNNSEGDMKVEIKHRTEYHYMDRVFLGPHTLRLTPRSDPHIEVHASAIVMEPRPVGSSHVLETNGTAATFAWFKGMTDVFCIESRSIVETHAFNPFDFLIYPGSCIRLPMVYPPEWLALLGPYLGEGQDMPDLKTFALDLLNESQFETISFLINLCGWIGESFEYEKREQGPPNDPLDTLQEKKGSCRDFAVFAIAVCQQLGLACRYVSGYLLGEDSDEPGELHAWFEVFLPGAGWRAFDPTHGVACNHYYVTLSTSADPILTLPVTGTYRGATSSSLKVVLDIQSLTCV